MAVFKCKMCGGSLEIRRLETVATCEYCGAQQTIPNLSDDRLANLYDRANHLRRSNEFDKATAIYEQILNENTTDAEAYWSLVLCRYGIEYVEDPSSHRRLPTVHRSQYTSIFDDNNYKCAMQYADETQRAVYEAEAKAINNIQKSILAISQKEEPFDVFICYKETDDLGRRTPDSVLANDLYHQLTIEGFKVFYARITLEDKLGAAYEPYIFAALNSAKVMVVIGTQPDYFKAVWVRNEWVRYLALIKQGQPKMLIPAYKDMDPYNLPEEFSHLQAQDMSKLGFMQDLIRGIKKIVRPEAETGGAKEVSDGVAPLLKRAFLFLEDCNWYAANDYCEKVLDIQPENAWAYVGKLMCDMRVRQQDELYNMAMPFDTNVNYQKALRFADEGLKQKLIDYIQHIINRNETTRLNSIYMNAKQQMVLARKPAEYEKAATLFASIPNYLDAPALAQECRDKATRISKRNKTVTFSVLGAVSLVVCAALLINLVIIPFSRYRTAMTYLKDNDVVQAYEAFIELGDYKNSGELAQSIAASYTKEMLKSAAVGDYLYFGRYDQDNDAENGSEAIRWLVLDVQDGKALLISKFAIDTHPYHASYADVTWKNCSLRKWMNTALLTNAFTEEEQEMILPTSHEGEDTTDSIFALNSVEFVYYFRGNRARVCQATDTADENGAYVEGENKNCWWWLRSAEGTGYETAPAIDPLGELHSADPDDHEVAVRLALWVTLPADAASATE